MTCIELLTLYPYGLPSGSVTFVSQSKNPHPCFAVRTPHSALISSIDSIHVLTLRFVGLKERGFEASQPAPASQPFQLEASHPGSPSWKNVAMLK